MAAPHTRPIGVTVHGTRPELSEGHEAWFAAAEVPGSAVALMEYRLGEAGHPAMGFAVHVPHYLARRSTPRPRGCWWTTSGWPPGCTCRPRRCTTAAERTEREIAEQVAGSEEVAQVVAALERQYDTVVSGRGSVRAPVRGRCRARTSSPPRSSASSPGTHDQDAPDPQSDDPRGDDPGSPPPYRSRD